MGPAAHYQRLGGKGGLNHDHPSEALTSPHEAKTLAVADWGGYTAATPTACPAKGMSDRTEATLEAPLTRRTRLFFIKHICIKVKETIQIQIHPERIQRTAVPPKLHRGP